uniref:Uncharacterized protein LOC108053020 n=1 Tax=Drosophila rhopaloa TaxID=1041015 RepID=A0A6P4FNM4_DRORH
MGQLSFEEDCLVRELDSRYYGFLDLSKSKNSEIKSLVQQTVANFQNYIANGQAHEMKNALDNKNVIQKYDPSNVVVEHMENTSSQNDEDTKILDKETNEKNFICDEKPQDEQYVNALCKLGHLHLLLGEYSEGK